MRDFWRDELTRHGVNIDAAAKMIPGHQVSGGNVVRVMLT